MILISSKKLEQNIYCIAGGRILGVTSEGGTLESAIDLAYKAISKIDTSNLIYRTDIGSKGLVKNG